MPRFYAAFAALLIGFFGYAQYNHLSVWGSDAGAREPSRLSSTGTRGK